MCPPHSVTQPFTALKVLCSAYSSPPLSPWVTPDLTVSIVLPFLNCHRVGTIQYVAFQTGIFHLIICTYVSSMSSHGLIVHFLSMLNNMPLSIYTTVCLATYLGTSGCFQVLAMMNKGATNTMRRFLCRHMFSAPLGSTQGV